MPKFAYTGTTRGRENVSGVVEAADELEAKMRLRAMQVRATSLNLERPKGRYFGAEKPEGGFKGLWQQLGQISIGKVLDRRGLYVFTRQFSSLIDAGVPVVQCLDILIEQGRSLPFKRVLSSVRGSVESGSTLAAAMAKHPKVFPELMITMVEAGEVSGTLDLALRRVGVQFEKMNAIRVKVKAALMYPIITVVVAIGVMVFLLVKVIPEVARLYTQSNAKLPELTQNVLDLSAWVQHNYIYIFVGTIAVFMILGVLAKIQYVREVWDPFIIRVPLIGDLIVKSTVTRFCRTISTLIMSGVPLLNSFEVSAKLITNLAMRRVVKMTAVGVSEGKSIALGLGRRRIFPPMVTHMVSIGEVTGKLDELFGKVADIYEEEVDDAVNTLTTMIQPALIVVVGGMVAFLLIAMYLPIFQLAETVAGV